MNYETAVENLKKYFGATTSDYIPIDEVFRNADRGNYARQANRTWSHGKFSAMKPHGLFKTVKGVEDHKYVTVGIRLTDKGRAAIRSGGTTSNTDTQGQTGLPQEHTHNMTPVRNETPLEVNGVRLVSLDTIFADIETLKKQSPSLDIEFSLSIKSKEVTMQ